MKYVLRFTDEQDRSVYYSGYGARGGGPIFTGLESAYRFPRRDYAENVLNGDERLKGFKIDQVE